MKDNPKILFRGMEMVNDDKRIKAHLLPKGIYPEGMEEGDSPYFKKYGFRVPKIYSQLYERYNGIKSDKYISGSLYYFTIFPYLSNNNMSLAYVDKNNYERLFQGINMPKTIIHNVNGKYFQKLGDRFLSFKEIYEILVQYDEFVIKPAIITGGGREVKLFSNVKNTSIEKIKEILNFYHSDFIIQERAKQSPKMAIFNESSLNSYRVYTYFNLTEKEYVVLGTAIRFGSKNDFKDNLSSGGGMCRVNEKGIIEDKIYQYCNFNKGSLSIDKGITNFAAPYYNEVINLCISLHKTLPYFDIVGWDICIDDKEKPLFIEFNEVPDCELIQIFNGPMFGKYTDSLMEAIKEENIQTKSSKGLNRIFPTRPHHNYNFEFGKKNLL